MSIVWLPLQAKQMKSIAALHLNKREILCKTSLLNYEVEQKNIIQFIILIGMCEYLGFHLFVFLLLLSTLI